MAKGEKMSDDWKCPNCGQVNTGKVSGVFSGDSFSEDMSRMREAAERAQRICAFCGAERVLIVGRNLPGRAKKEWSRNSIIALVIGGGLAGLFFLAVLAAIFLVIAKSFLSPKQTVVFEPDRSRVADISHEDLEQTASILTKRWRSLGSGYASVSFTVAENGQITGKIPKDTDPALIERTKATGLVEFVDFGDTALPDGTRVDTDFGLAPSTQASGTIFHTIMTNAQIRSASVQIGSMGDYQVDFTLDGTGKTILADFTHNHIGSYLGIVLDKVILSTPRINSEIPNGEGVIAGSFTKERANEVAMYLQMGILPVPLK
jgi:hypothetical protein